MSFPKLATPNPEEIERRTASVIQYLRTRVGPDDSLLKALLARQSPRQQSRADTGSSSLQELRAMAERCGLVEAQTPAEVH